MLSPTIRVFRPDPVPGPVVALDPRRTGIEMATNFNL
jgi:hypothetical protein